MIKIWWYNICIKFGKKGDYMGDKILVIEDDEDIRQMLCDYFIKDGLDLHL